MSLNRRFSKGLTLGVAYTWSKLLTTNPFDRGQAAYNTYDLKESYGPSALNTPQMFVMSYVYDFPFYKDQRGVIGHFWVDGNSQASRQSNLVNPQTVTQSNDPWSMVTTANTTRIARPHRPVLSIRGAWAWAAVHDHDPRRSERKCQWAEVRRQVLQHFRICNAVGTLRQFESRCTVWGPDTRSGTCR